MLGHEVGAKRDNLSPRSGRRRRGTGAGLSPRGSSRRRASDQVDHLIEVLFIVRCWSPAPKGARTGGAARSWRGTKRRAPAAVAWGLQKGLTAAAQSPRGAPEVPAAPPRFQLPDTVHSDVMIFIAATGILQKDNLLARYLLSGYRAVALAEPAACLGPLEPRSPR